MHSVFDDELFDTLDETQSVAHLKNMPASRKSSRHKPGAKPRTATPLPAEQELAAQQQDERFHMTYKAARHEAIWLESSLENFFTQKWFDDVLRMVKGGKEASVYLCRGNASTGQALLAAKVYRPRRFRNLKNDWLYREGRGNLDESGRQITNKGMLHAMGKRTEYGRELLHTSWLEHEFKTLSVLREAGADVPRPFASSGNAILMEYFGDEVMGAPTLSEVELPAGEVKPLFERVLHNIELMLAQGRIHGDLSAFNILYWEGQITLIDFPQAVRPNENRSAYRIFERDVTRVCEYFQRLGLRSNPRQLAAEMWQRYQYNFIPIVDPHMIDENDDADILESLKNG